MDNRRSIDPRDPFDEFLAKQGVQVEAEGVAFKEIAGNSTVQTTLPRLYERDIDVLLQEELIFNSNVVNLFAKALHFDALRVHACLLSVVESNGETDVQATYSCRDQEGILLIENKIDAAFQPRQGERYKERAAKLGQGSNCQVSCVLIAPKTYAEAAEKKQVENFDALISYEEVAAAIAAEDTPRSRHRSALLLRAVEQARRTYILVPAPEVTDFWRRVYDIASLEFTALKMKQPSEKGRSSQWIVFKGDLPPKVQIDWKITAAIVELAFWRGRLSEPLQSLALRKLPPSATIGLSGESEVIRLPLLNPPTDWINMPDGQIREALQGASCLLEFFNQNQSVIKLRD